MNILAEVNFPFVKSLKFELGEGLLIAGIVPAQDDSKSLLVDHFNLSALVPHGRQVQKTQAWSEHGFGRQW